ncbi:putative ferric-chelate reductase 1 [Ptychodera flava]|uniref:putative ferric-chelate reductase 1 n=1 Tax=Ptychodera flava TaxID=63121 RepID=UPI00396A0D33
MQCRFTLIRSIVIEEGALKNMTFNLGDGYYIFIVRAFAMKRAGAIYLAKHRVLPIISANKMDFNSVAVETSVAKRPFLLKCHAVTMLAGWVCCASIAIFFAKYFKGSWPNSTLCGHKVWFAMHGFLMLTNVICTVAGFVTVFIYVGGFVHYKKMYQPIFVHTCCGIAATALSLITSVMALFRPHTGTEK